MAHLRPHPSRDGDRGQLLLIAAFIIAVSFVVLALVVNSAIFTENLATRDDVAGSGDALEYRHEVTESVGEIISDVNGNNSLGSTAAQSSVENISRQGGLQQSTQGRIVAVEYDATITGTKIAQDTAGNFTNATGTDADWTVAAGVPSTRNLRFNITQDSDLLNSPDDFRMVVVNGTTGTEWTLTIAEETLGTDTVEITVSPPGVSPVTCERDVDPYLVIDVTSGIAGGERCHALSRLSDGTPMWFGTGVEAPYRIDFENPVEINGTYSFVIEKSSVSSDVGSSSGDKPYSTSAVYGMLVEYSFYTSDVGYEADIRVAPGEVPP